MEYIREFVNAYGMTIIYAVVTAIAGFFATKIKKIYEEKANDKTKKDVVKICVQAVEQIYKDLHGEEKYNEVVRSVSEMLDEKGISITELEIKMLIESTVGEFNKVFETEEEKEDIEVIVPEEEE